MDRDPAGEGVSVVAILKGEEAFVEEWIAYHTLIGVERFLIYDNDPAEPLVRLLAPYRQVEVVPWPARYDQTGVNPQLAAYQDALGRLRTEWVAFIDGDEFIALRRHARLQDFLAGFRGHGSVVLAWHLYGHNGHYSDPKDLITQSLVRRRRRPSHWFKAVSRVRAVAGFRDVHWCQLQPGWATVDVWGRRFEGELAAELEEEAHINHYMCRSFQTWMKRVARGHTHYDGRDYPRDTRWHFDEKECLKQFVTIVSKDWNELADEHMLRYGEELRAYLAAVRSGA